MSAKTRSSAMERQRQAFDEAFALQLRDPYEIVGQGISPRELDSRLFRHRAKGDWWDILDELRSTLIVSREYEHLLMAMTVRSGRPEVSFQPIAHPTGLAFDARRGVLWVASTRNPNQLVSFGPSPDAGGRNVFAPLQAHFFPGRTYVHDLALCGGRLHCCATGMNGVVGLDAEGGATMLWWPRSVEHRGRPRTGRNLIQLNSMAAGSSAETSYYCASSAAPGRYAPGHLRYPVDGEGVVFDGRTREPMARGLTRPHSLRKQGRAIWVANSGYGEIGRVDAGCFERLARLPGWTRGLAVTEKYVIAGTSRVLRRFRSYAPGLDPDRCETGIHILDKASGRSLGSLVWPFANQLFGIELVPREQCAGFPSTAGQRLAGASRQRFYFSYGLQNGDTIQRSGK